MPPIPPSHALTLGERLSANTPGPRNASWGKLREGSSTFHARVACSAVALAELNELFADHTTIAHPEVQRFLAGLALTGVTGTSAVFAIRTTATVCKACF